MRKIFLVLVLLVAASAALAVTPGTEVYLPSVAHGQGTPAGGIAPQWRSDAWVYNPSTTLTAHVTIYLMDRLGVNNAQVGPITIAPGETKEYIDIVLSTFNKDGVYGALRFVSDNPIVVTGRIYDDNVVTNIGTGTAGQFFAGLSVDQAVGVGKTTDLIGLAQDAGGVWRSNYGFVETSGNAVTITVELLNSLGVVIANWSNPLGARGAQQFSLAKFPGAPKGINQRIRARATSGTGKFLMYASRVDNRTGDPSTVEMTTTGGSGTPKIGRFEGIVLKNDNVSPNGGLTLNITASAISSYSMLTGLPCPTDADGVVVDTLGDNVPIDVNGHFTATIAAWPYKIGNTTVFTTAFTLVGDRNADGSYSGTLTTVTTGGVNRPEFDYSTCNGTITGRIWRAGYTGTN